MTALSFSRLDVYLQCPKKFESKFITKDYPDDSNNPALVRGKEIHSQLEGWMKASLKQDPLPNLTKDAKGAVPILTNVLNNYHSISPEIQMAIDSNWTSVDWFSKDAYYRAVIDLFAMSGDDTAILMDYKTGKVRPYEAGKYTQLGLTASMVFSTYPQLETIKCYYLFVDHKQTSPAVFKREELEGLKKPFIQIHEEVNNATAFPAKPNKYCRGCKVPNCEFKK